LRPLSLARRMVLVLLVVFLVWGAGPAQAGNVVVATSGVPDDFIISASIGYVSAVTKSKGVAELKLTLDLSQLGDGVLFVDDHGNKTSIGKLSADDFSKILTAGKLPKNSTINAIACESATFNQSLSKKLEPSAWAGLTLIGYKGCLIADINYLQEVRIRVVKDGKEDFVLGIQEDLIARSKGALKKAYDDCKAKFAADTAGLAACVFENEEVKEFYKALIAEADRFGGLYPVGEGIEVLRINSPTQRSEKQKKSSNAIRK
jgi:hypothetical protein